LNQCGVTFEEKFHPFFGHFFKLLREGLQIIFLHLCVFDLEAIIVVVGHMDYQFRAALMRTDGDTLDCTQWYFPPDGKLLLVVHKLGNKIGLIAHVADCGVGYNTDPLLALVGIVVLHHFT
jgi:hypothetical protein